MSGVKKFMKIWGKFDMHEYAKCGEKETMAHIMACKDKAAVQQFCDLVEKLDQWMMKAIMEPNIQELMKQRQLTWK